MAGIHAAINVTIKYGHGEYYGDWRYVKLKVTPDVEVEDFLNLARQHASTSSDSSPQRRITFQSFRLTKMSGPVGEAGLRAGEYEIWDGVDRPPQ